MRRILFLMPIMVAMAACARTRAIANALYIAFVHNSGAPPRAELRRIDERTEELFRGFSARRIVIAPVALLGRPIRYDTATAELIAGRLRALGVAGARATTIPVPLPFEPQPNEAAIYWTRFKALGAAVATHPRDDADYLVVVDVFGAPDRGVVNAVHVMAVTRTGELAYGGAWNSHQALYKEIKPRSLDAAARMIVTELDRRSRAAR